MSEMRFTSTGGFRDNDDGKIAYFRHFSSLAFRAFGAYLHLHRQTALGLREPDNWKIGLPGRTSESQGRHFLDAWTIEEGFLVLSDKSGKPISELYALCAEMFNLQARVHELVKAELGLGKTFEQIWAEHFDIHSPKSPPEGLQAP